MVSAGSVSLSLVKITAIFMSCFSRNSYFEISPLVSHSLDVVKDHNIYALIRKHLDHHLFLALIISLLRQLVFYIVLCILLFVSKSPF